MNVFSLFSGIGGLELGLERAGMTVAAQVEIDPYCRRVLAKYWPEVPRHDDVRTCVDWWWRGTWRLYIDLICGGFPCQPISQAGLRLVQADPRWLWPAMAAVIRHLRPRWVLMENVADLTVRGMGDVLGDLAACGYDADWDCIPAAAVGAPHRRERIFIVAHTNSPARRVTTPVLTGTGGPQVLPTETAGSRRRGGNVADTDSERLEGGRLSERPWHRTANLDWRGPGLDWRRPETSQQWLSEPDVGRVAHGVPARLDRLRALGNAVVPQVAEHVGRLILAADREAVTL